MPLDLLIAEVAELLAQDFGIQLTPDQPARRAGGGLRAIEVLERVGTSEARAVLESLSRGAAQAPRTREAKVALERMRNSMR